MKRPLNLPRPTRKTSPATRRMLALAVTQGHGQINHALIARARHLLGR